MPLSGRVSLAVTLDESKTMDFSLPHWLVDQGYVWSIGSGTGLSQADVQFVDQRTLAASASDSLDFSGALAGAYGTTVAMVKLRALIVYAAPANPGALTVARPAANGVPIFNAASGAIDLEPGGLFVYLSPAGGKTVTPATGDLVSITAAATAGSYVYDLYAIGTSA